LLTDGPERNELFQSGLVVVMCRVAGTLGTFTGALIVVCRRSATLAVLLERRIAGFLRGSRTGCILYEHISTLLSIFSGRTNKKEEAAEIVKQEV
jgi:hypothetical protein